MTTLCVKPHSHWICLAASASEWGAWRGRRRISGRAAARRSSGPAGGGCIARWQPAAQRICVSSSPSEKGRGGTAAGEGGVRKGRDHFAQFGISSPSAVGLPEARSRQKPRETPQCSTRHRSRPVHGKMTKGHCAVLSQCINKGSL